MRTSFDILKRDLLALVKNPIALLVVGALLVLPGLYAWYCIVANWDPYSHTGNMPIAIVNEDKGAKNNLAGDINIGKQVTEQLKDNDSIDWQFFDSEEEALQATRYADVYATIVMPENLSENLVGIFEGSHDPPTIFYYPNEKYNAVATKVCDSAAQTLVRQINQGFSSTVNRKVLESTQGMSDSVEEKADQTNKSALAEIKEVQKDLDKVIASLDDASSAIAGWRQAAGGASDSLAMTNDKLPVIATALDDASNQLNGLRTKTDSFQGELSKAILDTATAIAEMSGQAATSINEASADLKAAKAQLEAVEKAAKSYPELEMAAVGLEVVVTLVDGIVIHVDERVSEINGTVQGVAGDVTNATNRITGEVMPQMSSATYNLALSFARLSGAISQFGPEIEGLRGVFGQTDSALATATSAIADAKTLLGTISKDLKGTIDDIGAIGKALEIEQLRKLLDVDPENAGTFISTPVKIVTEKINPVSNYGTAVAPFYTNLALWIGCFILVSLMKVEVTGFAGATARQRYFGRWLLFVILSLLQSQVICGVDILLGIDCAHPALFMLAGAFCSFAYMNLIYALVKTFRNIGKTLCIFLLIMQVPGSSGMYPIQMMPEFFQFIHPALPFTYGIDAMREALCGLYGMAYLGDLVVILLIVPGALVVGLALRPLMASLLILFDREMAKVGFFPSEVNEEGLGNERMRGMLRALMGRGDIADDVEERAWRFNRMYPHWRKLGSISLIVVPLAVLVLMLPANLLFNPSTDTKLTVLIIMLVALFVVQVGLIALERAHRTIEEETRLIGANLLDGFDLESLAAEPADGSASGSGDAPSGMVTAADGLRARPPYGNPASDIFATDVRLGFQSVIGVVVIALLVLTPSMYAWFNIAGSWDPYSATGNLKVAVANEDEGYKGDLLPMTIDVGATIESQLRGNSSFDWVFVDSSKEAVDGVNSSEYYAAIVIPHDFSSNLLTYLTDDTDYPAVTYYTNEKENPIAPIITQKGADSIQESIRVSFTERVDEVVLGVAQDILEYVKKPDMSSYVTKMSRHLDDALGDTKSASSQVRTLASLLTTTSSIVSQLGSSIDGLRAAGASAKAAIGDAKAGAEGASSAIDQALAIAEELIGGSTVDVDKVKAVIDIAFSLLEEGANAVPASIQERIDEFENLGKGLPDGTAKEACDTLVADLEKAKQHAEATAANVDAARSRTDGLLAEAQAEVDAARGFLSNDVKPAVEELRSSLSTIATSTSEIVKSLESVVSGVGDSTGGLSNQLSLLSDGLAKAGDKLESSATKIGDTKTRVAEALKSGDLKQIEDVVMGSDTEAMAASLANPVQLAREAMYPVSNYGSAMAPFYTVLSLWVGALVMISTMRVRIAEERIEELRRRYAKVHPRHEFFGRYGIFGLIGLMQSTLVLLGDLLFLHIQCASPVLFFLFGIFIGQVFCLIVYTITELFGDVGKALCVILLIMQVAASGGTFPIQMFDPILGHAAPYLPFYYAMILLQECVAGILWPNMAVCIVALIAMAGAMLIIGLPLRRPFRRVNVFFEEQLEKTGYM